MRERESRGWFAVGDTPKPRLFVIETDRKQLPAIRAKQRLPQRCAMRQRLANLLARFCIPNPCSLVFGSRQDPCSIWAETRRRNRPVVFHFGRNRQRPRTLGERKPQPLTRCKRTLRIEINRPGEESDCPCRLILYKKLLSLGKKRLHEQLLRSPFLSGRFPGCECRPHRQRRKNNHERRRNGKELYDPPAIASQRKHQVIALNRAEAALVGSFYFTSLGKRHALREPLRIAALAVPFGSAGCEPRAHPQVTTLALEHFAKARPPVEQCLVRNGDNFFPTRIGISHEQPRFEKPLDHFTLARIARGAGDRCGAAGKRFVLASIGRDAHETFEDDKESRVRRWREPPVCLVGHLYQHTA